MEQIDTTVVQQTPPAGQVKPKRVYKKRSLAEVQQQDAGIETPPISQGTKKQKQKRNVDPNKMTYLKAFAMWREKNNYCGLSPKKFTDEYNQIMSILAEHKQK